MRYARSKKYSDSKQYVSYYEVFIHRLEFSSNKSILLFVKIWLHYLLLKENEKYMCLDYYI